MTFVPGFPKLVFLLLAAVLLGIAAWRMRDSAEVFRRLFRRPPVVKTDVLPSSAKGLADPVPPLVLELAPSWLDRLEPHDLHGAVGAKIQGIREEFGIPLPALAVRPQPLLGQHEYRLRAFGDTLASGQFAPTVPQLTADAAKPPSDTEPDASGSTSIRARAADERSLQPVAAGTPDDAGPIADAVAAVDTVTRACDEALRRNLVEFVGIQESADLLSRIGNDYPDLVKETLRAVAPQRVADVLRRLVAEGVPVRNLRRVLEAIADLGAREKDIVLLTEGVRVALKRQISHRCSDGNGTVRAILVQPELEDRLRQCVRVTNAGSQLAIEPELARRILDAIGECLAGETAPPRPVLVCSQDVRRHIRTLVETDLFDLPVLSFQELTPDLQIIRLGPINA